MTAALVGGVEVVASEPAHTALPPTANGMSRTFKQIVKLLLADGREVFGCVHCDYTADSIHSVRPHLKKHRMTVPAPTGVSVEDLTLGELLQQHQRAETLMTQLQRMVDSRNEWRARAQDAERSLSVLRTALRGVA